MIALDASVLIAYLDAADVHHERGRQALLAHDREPFCASTITITEALVGPVRRGEGPRIRSVITALGVESVPLDASDDLALAALRSSTGLKLPDCCVLLVAGARRAQVLSFDERLRRTARDHGLRADGR
ncbi:MAG: type II toxin-antitoxin system VapC family toxin [Solirubrobacteraceae bacterium]